MEWGSFGFTKHCHCVLVEKLIEYFIENSGEYDCENITGNISSFSPLNANVNTILKYYRKDALNKKLKLIKGAIKIFTKKLLGQEIFSSMIPGAMKYTAPLLLDTKCTLPYTKYTWKWNYVGNYKPISWLNLFWKLLASIINEKDHNHWNKQNLLPNEQRGCQQRTRLAKDRYLIDNSWDSHEHYRIALKKYAKLENDFLFWDEQTRES